MTIEAINYFETHYEQMISELTDFIAIPSVSTDPEHKENVQKAAEFIAAKLETIGLQHVQIFPTARHPIVYADYLQAGPTQPTILIYGHYDVQPEDQLIFGKHRLLQRRASGIIWSPVVRLT
jgi:acetylornithine deacetylase/succinyl-diaminopimelate desuccinylase-like protein